MELSSERVGEETPRQFQKSKPTDSNIWRELNQEVALQKVYCRGLYSFTMEILESVNIIFNATYPGYIL